MSAPLQPADVLKLQNFVLKYHHFGRRPLPSNEWRMVETGTIFRTPSHEGLIFVIAHIETGRRYRFLATHRIVDSAERSFGQLTAVAA